MSITNTPRHKQAYERGYQAYKEGKQLSDNYYHGLHSKYMAYAAKWDAGWVQAKKDKSAKTF